MMNLEWKDMVKSFGKGMLIGLPGVIAYFAGLKDGEKFGYTNGHLDGATEATEAANERIAKLIELSRENGEDM